MTVVVAHASMGGLQVVGHPSQVPLRDRWHPPPHRQPAGDVVREAEHDAALERLAER